MYIAISKAWEDTTTNASALEPIHHLLGSSFSILVVSFNVSNNLFIFLRRHGLDKIGEAEWLE